MRSCRSSRASPPCSAGSRRRRPRPWEGPEAALTSPIGPIICRCRRRQPCCSPHTKASGSSALPSETDARPGSRHFRVRNNHQGAGRLQGPSLVRAGSCPPICPIGSRRPSGSARGSSGSRPPASHRPPRDSCRTTRTPTRRVAECGRVHPALVDEYYFWLVDARHFSPPSSGQADAGGTGSDSGSYQFGIQDSYYDQVQQQSINWNDPAEVPGLLAWRPNPAVRLAWCRIHNGEFGQPRNSDDCVELDPNGGPAELMFLGARESSLFFKVEGAKAPPAGDTKDEVQVQGPSRRPRATRKTKKIPRLRGSATTSRRIERSRCRSSLSYRRRQPHIPDNCSPIPTSPTTCRVRRSIPDRGSRRRSWWGMRSERGAVSKPHSSGTRVPSTP